MLHSTDTVPQPHRLDFWIEAISRNLLSLQTSSPDAADFESHLYAADCDALRIVQVVGSRRDVYRTPEAIAGASQHCFNLLVDFSATWVANWRGARLLLHPGDLILMDSRRAHSVHSARACAPLIVRIPPAWLASWARDPEGLCGRRISCDTGWGQALSSFVAQLTPRFVAAAPLPCEALSGHLGALLSLVESEFSGAEARHAEQDRQLRARIGDAIRQMAGSAGLTAADVARALDIPVRLLDRALLQEGLTFSLLLTRCRTAMARNMLDARTHNRLTTAEIGRRAGFPDPSHFVRVMARELGTTPARYRAQRTSGKGP